MRSGRKAPVAKLLEAYLLKENEVSCRPPLTNNEVLGIAAQVAKYAASEVDNDHFTDMGNARRLARAHGADLRYCYGSRKWYVWDGLCWQIDDTGEVFRRAKEVTRDLYRKAGSTGDPEMRKQLAHHALKSEAAPRIEAMVKLAQSEEDICIRVSDFDRNPLLFNVANGTLNLQTGQLSPHKREDLLSKISPATFESNAVCPRFLEFLDCIASGNQELQQYLQRSIGYSLTGDVSENCFFLLYGAGANGKSTLLELMMYVWGQYAQAADFESFMASSKGRSVRNDIARTSGARLVKSVEADEGERLSEALIKQLTGNETVSARFLYQEGFDFKPQFKLWLGTNHKPKIIGTDDGMWRRVKLIPFEKQVPPAEQDRALIDKLKAEASGFLNWALEGLRKWQDHGLQEPEIILSATNTYREAQDTVKQFLGERCVLEPRASCHPRALQDAFNDWLAAARLQFKGRLAEKLMAMGYEQRRSQGKRWWSGIGLLDPGF